MKPTLFSAKTLIAVSLVVGVASARNPVPTLTPPVSPSAVAPESGAFLLNVYGANFVPGAVVNWNRSPRTTTYVSPRELQVQIPASDVKTATAGYITVTNPAPGGGPSSSSYGLVEVHKPREGLNSRLPHFYGSKQQGTVDVLVAADLNGDGILDLIDADSYPGTVRTRIGNGNGTFHRGSIVSTSYFLLGGLAFGDFNNDGTLDIVFSKGDLNNYPPTYAAVKLGNGKGGFKFGSQFGEFAVTTQFAVGDFNGGKLDVAVGDSNNAHVIIFLGNGDGTFTYLIDYYQPNISMIAADFNADGKLDLAVDDGDGGIWILIGNGDGTFQSPVELTPVSSVCAFGPPMLVSDFNGDGKFDLAFCNESQIGILLGNGDGTFQTPVYYAAGKNGDFTFAAGDFRSKGIVDFLISHDGTDYNSYAMFGNGDGTFQNEQQIQLPGPQTNGEGGIVVGDFNSDGLLDFIFQEGGWGIAEYLQK